MRESIVGLHDIVEHQYLTFMLGNELFAISTTSIKEIITYGNVTQIPLMHEYVDGITNVRGNVIPVILLSTRFEMPHTKPTTKTCIVIVRIIFEDEKCDIGLVVDKVDRVYEIVPSSMEEVPTFGTKVKREFLDKIGKVEGKFISILNSQTILDIDEISRIMIGKSNKRSGDD